eukprot:3234608-Amphidinium_carterae.1
MQSLETGEVKRCKQFWNLGSARDPSCEVVQMNWDAVDASIANLVEIAVPPAWKTADAQEAF